MKDILDKITAYREERGWSEYQLAEQAGLPQSTISSWYRKNMMPSLPSLDKVCSALGITFAQLYSIGEEPVYLTDSQKNLLESWSKLNAEQQAALLALIDKM